ncbi:MAG: type III polyketide synthase [Sediminibacterium sp.]
MTDIISIGTAVPAYRHQQNEILGFMQDIYGLDETEKRKLKFLYEHSGIETRYSAIPDFSASPDEKHFVPKGKGQTFPSLEQRMELYDRTSVGLSVEAIRKCIDTFITPGQITHLITISCTGMSAPGLDLQVLEAMQLAPDIFRTSVNFMGCYAAIHGLKLAKMICDSVPHANVVIVATELCTIHFQDEYTLDNAASSLLFADGSAAALLSNHIRSPHALCLKGFYSCVTQKGKAAMAWQLGSNGFQMKLSGYVPQLIEEDIEGFVAAATAHHALAAADITHWCIHPGGKRILDAIERKMKLPVEALTHSRCVLKRYGNMSSATILFVLNAMMEDRDYPPDTLMGLAFGPGLTMEAFVATKK